MYEYITYTYKKKTNDNELAIENLQLSKCTRSLKFYWLKTYQAIKFLSIQSLKQSINLLFTK